MIEIVYDRKRLRLTADGHAGFAEAGQDIVCGGDDAGVHAGGRRGQHGRRRSGPRLKRGAGQRARRDRMRGEPQMARVRGDDLRPDLRGLRYPAADVPRARTLRYPRIKNFFRQTGRGIEIPLGFFVGWRCEGAGAFACVPPFFSFFLFPIFPSPFLLAPAQCVRCAGKYAAARSYQRRCNSGGRSLTGRGLPQIF